VIDVHNPDCGPDFIPAILKLGYYSLRSGSSPTQSDG
jgi:hypothetical protein